MTETITTGVSVLCKTMDHDYVSKSFLNTPIKILKKGIDNLEISAIMGIVQENNTKLMSKYRT